MAWTQNDNLLLEPVMNDLVEIRALSKTYERGKQKVEVLHNINLDIKKGDFLALMGPSGSGKTTLLNLIGGLDAPTAGSLSVGGQDFVRASGRRTLCFSASWVRVLSRIEPVK